MSEPKRASRSWAYLSQLSVNYFGWLFCWIITTAYIIPNMLLGMVDNSVKNSRLGLMIGVANIILLILLPLVGTISDRIRSRLGRRRPFYLSAALSVSALTLLVVLSRNYPVLFVLLFLMHGAEALWFVNYALIRDIVPLERRGRISGLTNITSALGLLLAHAVSPILITAGRVMSLALIAGGTNTGCRGRSEYKGTAAVRSAYPNHFLEGSLSSEIGGNGRAGVAGGGQPAHPDGRGRHDLLSLILH